MEVKAKARYVRVGPRKVRRVAKLLVGRPVERALLQLRFLPHHGAKVLEKVLKSAIANAQHNYKLKDVPLFVQTAYVDAAAPLKRFRPRQRGRAFPIRRGISHVTVVVTDNKEGR